MMKLSSPSRNIEFIGDHNNDSIVLGNYGDAKITAKGNFNLSGIIFCKKNTVEISLDGDGTVSFTGFCKKLLIQAIDGDCTLDLSNLACDTVRLESGKGKSVTILGRTKMIEQVNLENEAVVKYQGRPLLVSYTLSGNAKIENITAKLESMKMAG
jgi:hypothetical protein